MHILEIVFHILTIMVALVMAVKYGFAKGLHSYHRDIIADDKITENRGFKLVIGAVYQAIAAGALAVAVAYSVLVFRVEPVSGFGDGYAFLIVCVLALPSMISTYRVEKATGIRTPWRFIALAVVLSAIAYAL